MSSRPLRVLSGPMRPPPRIRTALVAVALGFVFSVSGASGGTTSPSSLPSPFFSGRPRVSTLAAQRARDERGTIFDGLRGGGGSIPRSRESLQQQLQPYSTQRDVRAIQECGGGSQFWPPWPFNLLQGGGSSSYEGEEEDESGLSYPSPTRTKKSKPKRRGPGYMTGLQLSWQYLREGAKGGIRQLQQVSKALSYHLPPAAPPLLLLAIVPAKQSASTLAPLAETIAEEGAAAAASASSAPLLRTSVFARKVALMSMGISVVSWAHYEIERRKRLVPLPLKAQYLDHSRVVLPPFLPEEVPPLDVEYPMLLNENAPVVNDDARDDGDGDGDGDGGAAKLKEQSTLLDDGERGMLNGTSALSLPGLKRHLQFMYDSAPKAPQTFRSAVGEWRRTQRARQRERLRLRRVAIMDELIALQQLKKRAGLSSPGGRSGSASGIGADGGAGAVIGGGGPPPLGYALVTGASRGIGRALAVELARWEVPLILVARDVSRLTTLAADLATCYGVKVCVLGADLAHPGAAEKVHRATREAGLDVDVLVNNAGVCAHGEMVESDLEDVNRMIRVNTGSVAVLSRLYGKDMKERGRGRILFVSSVVGAVPAGPGVAVYAATKAFEKALCLSMSRELEKFGVGTTCLMPGAVRGTAFRESSGSGEAACWKVPFYPRSAPEVAKRGVRALLAGDPEVYPGWQNRLFLKLLGPVLPQRITTLIVEFAWNPLRLGIPRMPWAATNGNANDVAAASKNAGPDRAQDRAPPTAKPRMAPAPRWGLDERLPPHVLTLPSDVTAKPPVAEEDAERADTGKDQSVKKDNDAAGPDADAIESETIQSKVSETQVKDTNNDEIRHGAESSSSQEVERRGELEAEESLTS